MLSLDCWVGNPNQIWQPRNAQASSLPVSTLLSLSVTRAPALHNALHCASALNWTIQRETKEDESWSQWAGIQSFLTAAGGRRQRREEVKEEGGMCGSVSDWVRAWRNRWPSRVQVDHSLFSPSSLPAVRTAAVWLFFPLMLNQVQRHETVF